jgi:2-(1,2-epoxy-1,2-dihydrophenyl)acetyl-CoA isomerase
MDLTTMSYEVRDGVAHVRFTRPEGANAVNPAFSADLRAVMLAIEFDDAVKAVSVTADGKVFCAGGDLKLFYESGDKVADVAADMLVDFHGAISKMNQIPKPFFAVVRGAAGGAGLSLMGAFDLVVTGESAKFTMAYTKAGVTPDGTSSYFIARHIGLRRMLDLSLTNRVLTAA